MVDAAKADWKVLRGFALLAGLKLNDTQGADARNLAKVPLTRNAVPQIPMDGGIYSATPRRAQWRHSCCIT